MIIYIHIGLLATVMCFFIKSAYSIESSNYQLEGSQVIGDGVWQSSVDVVVPEQVAPVYSFVENQYLSAQDKLKLQQDGVIAKAATAGAKLADMSFSKSESSLNIDPQQGQGTGEVIFELSQKVGRGYWMFAHPIPVVNTLSPQKTVSSTKCDPDEACSGSRAAPWSGESEGIGFRLDGHGVLRDMKPTQTYRGWESVETLIGTSSTSGGRSRLEVRLGQNTPRHGGTYRGAMQIFIMPRL